MYNGAAPTPAFRIWAKDTVSAELHMPSPGSVEAVAQRLWAAAQFDVHAQNQTICLPAAGGGFLLTDDGEYERAIAAALAPLTDWFAGHGGADEST